MPKWVYYRLLDAAHKNVIVRTQGRVQQRYDTNNKAWIRTGIMLEYFCDASDTYDMYEEIAESELPFAI